MLHLTKFGGTGPKAYFIHGFASDSQSWIANIPAVTGAVEAIGIDLPAHGHSVDLPVPDSLERIAMQVIESIDTSAPCMFVGHSAGGAIAMLCATKLPVSALCLISPAGLGVGVNRSFLQQLIDVQTEDEALQLLQTMVANKRLVSKFVITRLLSHLRSDSGREKWQCFANRLFESQQDLNTSLQQLAHMDIPIQVHWGKDDVINPMSETDCKRLPATWHLYDDCGHLPHIEQWSAYNDALNEFIVARS